MIEWIKDWMLIGLAIHFVAENIARAIKPEFDKGWIWNTIIVTLWPISAALGIFMAIHDYRRKKWPSSK
jgi:hypothetical protein